MKKQKQQKFTHIGDKSFTAWEQAILDTEAAILRTRERLRGLKAALRVFKDRRESGEPWPGTSESESGDLGQKGDLGQSLSCCPVNTSYTGGYPVIR